MPSGDGRRAGHDGGPVFTREGEYWTIVYDGQLLRLRDAKGLRYLGHLLRHTGQFFQAAELREVAGGRNARAADDAEAARVAVTKRIKAAIAKIGALHRGLGYHLSTAVKTGYACAYLPDPERPIAWTV
jgi:hypothetical protein